MTAIYEDRARRYDVPWRNAFDEALDPFLVTNAAVLDIGSGREPSIRPEQRPRGCHYVGLDVSEHELRLAGADAYDEVIVADITTPDPGLVQRFDLVLSWQVLEHVRPLEGALDNIYSYLQPGGVVVAQLSGKFSAYALLNRLTPDRFGVRLLARFLGRDAGTVFPAYYDRCYASALARMLDGWSDVRIVPRFRGAGYFSFSRAVQRFYLRYEDWAMLSGRNNLATHYLLVARK